MSAVRFPLSGVAASRIRAWVLGAFPPGQSGIDYGRMPGDPSLSVSASATWRVHADFRGMPSGGLCARKLHTLQARAVGAVWAHSNSRDDLVGRLRRTTAFVAGTP